MPGDPFLNLSPIALVVFLLMVFVAAIVRGYSGFGFSTVLMIGAMPVISPAQLVPISIGLEILASISQAPRILVAVNRRYLIILLAASVFGVPIGVYLLAHVAEEYLRAAVYFVVFAATLLILTRKPKQLSPTGVHLVAAGFIAGVVNGATSLSGLVLALFFTASSTSSQIMRATMIAYLFFSDLFTGGLLVATNHYDATTLLRILVAIPFLLAGVWLGSWKFFVTPSQSFKAIVIWLILAFCIVGATQLF